MGRRTDAERRRKALFARDGKNCGICGGELGTDISIDHILAKRNGGSNRLENLRLAHRYCNQKKNQFLDQKFHIINRAKAQKQKGEQMSKLEIAVLMGAESKEWLADLTRQLDRLEKLTTTEKAAATNGKARATTAAGEDPEPEKVTISVRSAKTNGATKTTKTTKAATTTEDDDADFDLGIEDDATEETPVITKKDLIAACRDNREAAIKVLKKMKVANVHELKPNQYAKVLAEIGA
jgi:hypothetical protein